MCKDEVLLNVKKGDGLVINKKQLQTLNNSYARKMENVNTQVRHNIRNSSLRLLVNLNRYAVVIYESLLPPHTTRKKTLKIKFNLKCIVPMDDAPL